MQTEVKVKLEREKIHTKTKKNSLINNIIKHKTLFIMLTPAVIYFLIFLYLPMAGIVIAFENFNYSKGIFASPWVGFENFKFFFVTGAAKSVTFNTFTYNAVFLFFNTVFQIILAIFLIMNLEVSILCLSR